MAHHPGAAGGRLLPALDDLPDLRIVATAALLLHEECDARRVERLRARLDAEGVLRNPPVVAPLDAGAYVVLDGANRVTALAQAGVPDLLVQNVAYDDPAVVLDVWTHVVADGGGLVSAEPGASAWRAMAADAVRTGLEDGWLACGLVTPAASYGVAAESALDARVRQLNRIVAAYSGRAAIFRVPPPRSAVAVDELLRDRGPEAALVLFPRLAKAEVRAIARLPVKLPTGITRHIIPLRALRVNVDLSMLRAAEPTSAKQARLDELISARLRDRRVRHYPEATVLFDE